MHKIEKHGNLVDFSKHYLIFYTLDVSRAKNEALEDTDLNSFGFIFLRAFRSTCIFGMHSERRSFLTCIWTDLHFYDVIFYVRPSNLHVWPALEPMLIFSISFLACVRTDLHFLLASGRNLSLACFQKFVGQSICNEEMRFSKLVDFLVRLAVPYARKRVKNKVAPIRYKHTFEG